MSLICKEDLLRDIEENVVCSVRDGHVSAEMRGVNKVLDRIRCAPVISDGHVCKSVDEVTEDLLTEMGIPTSLLGYKYLTCATRILISGGRELGTYNDLYPEIAKEYVTTVSRVERAIRHAIERCFDKNGYKVSTLYFGGSISMEKGKATNTEFIHRIVQLVKRRMGE